MVGIVVVAHSRPLARAAVALARQMPAAGEARIAVAAGLDEETLGTDATAVAAAIGEVDGPDGVVVLMDLGSAVLSAQTALELLDADVAARVLLSPAPLVEGLVAATVAAAAGGDRERVAGEAAAGLDGKVAHLGAADAPAAPEVAAGDAVVGARFTVAGTHGLHARPAARLVRLAMAADAEVELRNVSTGSAWAPAASMTGLVTLGAEPGHEVEVRATGPGAAAAVEEVLELAQRAFGD